MGRGCGGEKGRGRGGVGEGGSGSCGCVGNVISVANEDKRCKHEVVNEEKTHMNQLIKAKVSAPFIKIIETPRYGGSGVIEI